jgi:hypothetical protein
MIIVIQKKVSLVIILWCLSHIAITTNFKYNGIVRSFGNMDPPASSWSRSLYLKIKNLLALSRVRRFYAFQRKITIGQYLPVQLP